jgi:hypothetical protein
MIERNNCTSQPSRPALTRAACIGAGAVLAGGLLAWALQKRRAM